MKVINKHGQVVDLDDNAVIPDGYGIRASLFLMDATPTIGHRPGFVFAQDGEDDPATQAHAAYQARLTDAWRASPLSDASQWQNPDTGKKSGNVSLSGPRPKTADPEAAREEYITGLSNAWRTPRDVRLGGLFGE